MKTFLASVLSVLLLCTPASASPTIPPGSYDCEVSLHSIGTLNVVAGNPGTATLTLDTGDTIIFDMIGCSPWPGIFPGTFLSVGYGDPQPFTLQTGTGSTSGVLVPN